MEDYTAEMIRDMAFSFCPQCGTAICAESYYKTAPHVQTGKRKRDSDGFFTP